MVPLASPAINEIPHADRLTELRLATLHAGKCVSWKSDRELAIDPAFPRERFYGLIPDAVWTTPSDRRIAVEYERTRKGVARVRSKVETFSRELARPDRVFDLVLWVAAPGAYQDLAGILRTHPSQRLRRFEQFTAELETEAKQDAPVKEKG